MWSDAKADFKTCRRRYLAHQQAMETAIAPMRADIRSTIARRSPAMARLAAIDAVMEQALTEREHHVLSSVPGLIQQRFPHASSTHDANASPEAFGNDMRGVLLAELDIRLQPLEGLLEALRTS